MSLTTTLPDAKTLSLADLAEFYGAHLDEIREYDTFAYFAKRRLMEAVRDGGPIATSVGRLEIEPKTYEYGEEVAQEFPTLGHHIVTTTVDTIEEAERVISLVTEEIPDCDVAHSVKVDAVAANRVLRAGGDAAKRLLDLRTAKGRLALR